MPETPVRWWGECVTRREHYRTVAAVVVVLLSLNLLMWGRQTADEKLATEAERKQSAFEERTLHYFQSIQAGQAQQIEASRRVEAASNKVQGAVDTLIPLLRDPKKEVPP